MKGTISAIVPNAEKILINNPKEIQEHNTIVDLMRNDLGQIADNIKLKAIVMYKKSIPVKGQFYKLALR